MINIGPWWLFDIMAFAIIIGCTVWGMTRGFFITFYLLVLQIIVVILLMFIPSLLTNSINPLFMKLWVSLGVDQVFSFLGDSIAQAISSLLPGNGSFPIEGGGVGYEVLKTISALGLYLFFSGFVFIIVNLIGLLLYKSFKRKMKKMRVIGKVDTLIGAFNGLAIGMTLSMGVSFMASFPLFQTEHQRIGFISYSKDDENMTEEEIREKWLGSSAYKKYSLSRKIASPLPSVPVFGFTYTNACLSKYVLDPMMVMASQLIANKQISDLKDFFVIYEDLLAEGYSSSNPLSLPISACIDIMPQDSKSIFRLFSEMMLMGTMLFVDGVNPGEQTTVTSPELINALDNYYIATHENDEKIHGGWLNEKEFINFYKWAEDDREKNPFLKIADRIENKWTQAGKKTQRYIVKVLRDPKLTYNFFKSINYVNATSRSNLDTMPYLASIYSSTYLVNGMEIVPSGELKIGELDESQINHEPLWWKANYNDTYWIQYYFDFAKGYFN
ncbi:hypothetical protein [Spiroplasma monobiae]|uniref:Uncharacterized protein n=1 Tax=Spiroplasma monobiae MQ-1 TaxID=1336748 RepID=A0A2K9LUV4_SPISQ|nr:hypothetical protein [Spiroplasma monobiae]AUM62829.1 hypothetical protein SMONO_v1c05800 [Spiroplasma monobiae MQ-1]